MVSLSFGQYTDGLIELLETLISKKRSIKQAALQQLLTGKTRLPGFSGEWDQVPIGDLYAFKNGLNKAKEFFGSGTPIINYMDVFESSGLTSTNIKGRVLLTREETERFNVQPGDVFFTRTSETPDEIGVSAVLLDELNNGVFSGFVLRARPRNERVSPLFAKYCFSSEYVRGQIISTATYTTRALTNGRLLSSAKLLLPPSAEEQTAIANVLSDMDAEIEALETRLAKTHQLKQGMMQQLLTGRIRLVEPDSEGREPVAMDVRDSEGGGLGGMAS